MRDASDALINTGQIVHSTFDELKHLSLAVSSSVSQQMVGLQSIGTASDHSANSVRVAVEGLEKAAESLQSVAETAGTIRSFADQMKEQSQHLADVINERTLDKSDFSKSHIAA